MTPADRAGIDRSATAVWRCRTTGPARRRLAQEDTMLEAGALAWGAATALRFVVLGIVSLGAPLRGRRRS